MGKGHCAHSSNSCNKAILEPDHAITVKFKLIGAGLILFNLPVMDITIDLNHQMGFSAVEICNKRPQRMLATKFIAT